MATEAFKTVDEVLAAHMEGRWFKPESPMHRDMIIMSITGYNYSHAAALRHYVRDDYLVVTTGAGHDAETHPNDAR